MTLLIATSWIIHEPTDGWLSQHQLGFLFLLLLKSKARYTPATKLNSTRLTSLKVNCCWNRRQIGNEVDCRHMRSTLLPIGSTLLPVWQQIDNNLNSTACRGQHCRQLGSVARILNVLSTLSPLLWGQRDKKSTVSNSTLLPVCIGLKRPSTLKA